MKNLGYSTFDFAQNSPVFLSYFAAKAAKERADKLAADKAAADGLEIYLSFCRRYTSIETQFNDAIRV
jgi:hypothetical protein